MFTECSQHKWHGDLILTGSALTFLQKKMRGFYPGKLFYSIKSDTVGFFKSVSLHLN